MSQAAHHDIVSKVDPNKEIFSFKLSEFPTIDELRKAVLYARPAVALERSKLLVDYHEKNGFDLERPLLRQAKALDYILSNLTPIIFPGEQFVGSMKKCDIEPHVTITLRDPKGFRGAKPDDVLKLVIANKVNQAGNMYYLFQFGFIMSLLENHYKSKKRKKQTAATIASASAV